MPPANSSFELYILLIPLLPLLGFLINGIGFRIVPKAVAPAISSVAVLSSFVLSLLLYFNGVGLDEPLRVSLFDWISVGEKTISMSFLIDELTTLMLLLVTGVGSLIHLYSAGYMSHDEGLGKFFAFLNLFIFSMLLLVMGSNFVVMFIGWEGVGLCSFLLIGFWNKNRNYNAAAQKAFVMNRIGDLGFLAGIFLIFQEFGTVEYREVFAMAAETFSISDPMMIAITACLFIGAMGKSAQIPLFTWLPDAMAGPTPVSALIHAATMVTAGIYMIIRSNVLFTLAPETLEFVGWIGCATALLGATIGLLQNDIKKVLAYSTVSQLGYMFMALGVMAFSSGMFHVLTHAFFKACLFLGAGSVIHAMHDEQDIRKMGGLRKHMPITFITFLISTIAIAGIPPFSGFFSKDEILAAVYSHNKLMWGFALLGSFMTAFYMFRLTVLVFFGEFRGTDEQKKHLHESPATITIPLIVLAIMAIAGGFMGLPPVLSHHHYLAEFMAPLFEQAKKISPEAFGHHLDHSTEWMLIGISTGIALVGTIIAFVLFSKPSGVPASDEAKRNPLSTLIYNKWYIDEVYNFLIVKPLLILGDVFALIIEVLVIDMVVNLTGMFTKGSGAILRKVQTGSIGVYLFAMVIGMILFLFLNLYTLIF